MRSKVWTDLNGPLVTVGNVDFLTVPLAQHPRPSDPPESNLNSDNPDQQDFRQDPERDKSRVFLSKCSQEVAYHVIPASHPPPDLGDPDLSNHAYSNQMSQQSMEDAYIQQQRQKQQQANHMITREVVLQNHQPAVGNFPDNTGMPRAAHNQFGNQPLPRESMERRVMEQQARMGALDDRKQGFDQSLIGDHSGAMKQPYDGYGPQVAVREEGKHATTEGNVNDADSWNFDDPPVLEPPAEPIPPHRPDTDVFPNANFVGSKSPSRVGSLSHRRRSSGSRRRSDGSVDTREGNAAMGQKQDSNFNIRFALRGHLDVIRSVIFTGGGSPSEPEICTCSDDGTIKRWIIPATYGSFGSHGVNSSNDLEITSYFTHRGHVGAVTALASCSPQNFSNGGRALGDGWVFSGGQDASVRVWERGRVDPKATLDGHTDAVWGLCVLPGTTGSVFGDSCAHYGGPDRILLASGAADGRILIWAVSAPPLLSSPQAGSRRAGGSRRANSISSGSNFPSSPQPSMATNTPFHYMLVHHISRPGAPSPTCISPLSLAGVNFVVSCSDASILVYDTRTGEEIVGMASLETYNGTPSTGVNSVVATTIGFDGSANLDPNRAMAEEEVVHGATGSSGVEGVIISGYEDRYIRFFDANSGKCPCYRPKGWANTC